MSTARNVVYNMVNNLVNVASSIVVIPWVSRALGVEGIGAASFAQTYAELFTVFIALGIPLYGVREIGKCGDDAEARRAVVSELFRVMLVSTLVFGALYVVSVFSVPALRAQCGFLMVAGSVLLFAPFSVDWYFTGRENLRLVMLRNVIFKVAMMAAIFVFVRSPEDIVLYLIFGVALTAGSLLWTFFYMTRTEIRLRWRGLRPGRHLRPVMILFLSTVAVVAFTKLDTVMLGLMADNIQVGFYQSAIKTNKVFLPVITASAAAVIPRISLLYKEGNAAELGRVTGRSFSLVSLMAPPVAAGTFAVAPAFVPLYFGPGFEGAIPAMRILSFIVPAIAVSSFYNNQVLVATGRDKEFMWIVAAGMVVNFVLNLLLIPRWGAVGASWSSLAAEGAVVAATVLCVRRFVPEVRPSYSTLVRSLAASLPMLMWGRLFTACIDSAAGATAAIVAASVVSFAAMELWVFRDETAAEIKNRILKKITAG